MLKERKLKHLEHIVKDNTGKIIERYGDEIYGYCAINGYYDTLYASIKSKNIIKEIDDEEYYIAEVETSTPDTDYHTYGEIAEFKGLFLVFNLNIINTITYFNEDYKDILYPKEELINQVNLLLNKYELIPKYELHEVSIENNTLIITIPDTIIDEKIKKFKNEILNTIRNYYSKKNIHITRMFGSYILLKNENDNLKAIKATPIPIKYCPLMINLLKEIGGNHAEELIKSLSNEDKEKQTKLMCDLINKIVIAGGYFDTNRPLNSCESNVLFGASETMYSAFKTNLIDAAVIVSNNLGTIITTNAESTQGAVKRMTGLSFTSPNEKIIKTAKSSGIIPVFPYTAEIDQLEGVKKAISLGYKKIAVSVASHDNILHKKLKELELTNKITIYKFGLCTTGIDKETAISMKNYADIIWSCASKQIKEHIEPNSIAQIGIKIPVHIMTKNGWKIVRNHIELINNDTYDIPLEKGNDKKVLLNDNNKIRVLTKRDIHKCNDCPYPCI